MNNERLIMNSKTKIFFAKILTIAVIAVSIFQFGLLPAMAATATGISDTMSRNKVGITAVTHSVSMTLPSGPFSGTLTLTYANFTAFAGTPTGTCAGGSVGSGTASSNIATVTLTTCGAGTLTITSFTGTNPAAAGSNTVTIAGAAGITGSFAVASVTDDQVGVSASVDPTITFDVGAQASATACATTFSVDGGTVALGTLSTTTVTSSDLSSVMHICSRLTTNAASGAVVTVKSLNGNLKSTSATSDVIASNTATPLATGTSGYGLCVGSAGGDTGMDATTPVGVLPTRISPFNNASCTSAAHNIGAVTQSAQSIWSVSAASQNAFARIYVKAGISGTVVAHADYADTLTFVATGTF